MVRFDLAPGVELQELGFIPFFLSDHDTRSAREQLHEHYAHGGGWRPFAGWTREGVTIRYADEDPLTPLASARLREETVLIYDSAWVMILQTDGSFEVSRMD